MMSNGLLEEGREPMKNKRIDNEETVAEYIAARRRVKRIVKQE